MEVLTLAPGMDPRHRMRQLRRQGYISKQVRIRNMWHELRRASDSELSAMRGTTAEIVLGDELHLPQRGKQDVERTDDAGALLQVNRFRRNGSLLLTDRQDVKKRGARGGRRLTLFNRRGRPIAQWSSATSFYHAWLDSVAHNDPASVLISDSAFVGAMMHSYRRESVALVQVLHSHHLDETDGRGSRIAAGKLPILRHADQYDHLVVLTGRQRQQMIDSGLVTNNITAIPNTFRGDILPHAAPRSPEKGIMVARLSPIKRIGHAIDAVAAANTAPQPTLDIFGEGNLIDGLRDHVTSRGADDRIVLHGHDPNARSRFKDASFSLLTSRNEGQGLVLLESMANGCIPIAYDIDFGPRDIITHGTNGFLVAPGDTDQLAETIEAAAELDDATLSEMRESALRRAADFAPVAVVGEWAQLLNRVLAEKRPALVLKGRAELLNAEANDTELCLRARIHLSEDAQITQAQLFWNARKAGQFGRVEASIDRFDDHLEAQFALPLANVVPHTGDLIDFSVDLHGDGGFGRLRISTASAELPVAFNDFELYSTVHGNVSLRVPK